MIVVVVSAASTYPYALTYGDVSHHLFTDELAQEARLVALRRKVAAHAEPQLDPVLPVEFRRAQREARPG